MGVRQMRTLRLSPGQQAIKELRVRICLRPPNTDLAKLDQQASSIFPVEQYYPSDQNAEGSNDFDHGTNDKTSLSEVKADPVGEFGSPSATQPVRDILTPGLGSVFLQSVV